jgi:hypothetical protein
MSQVITLLLASGQEIIGRFDRTAALGYAIADEAGVNSTITLEKVRVVAPMQTPDGRIQVSLMPYVFSNIDTDVQIASDQIVGIPKAVSSDMEREYLAQTSGLVMAH